MLGAVRFVLQYAANGFKAHANGAIPHNDGDALKISITVVAVSVELIVRGADQTPLFPVVKRAHGQPVQGCSLSYGVLVLPAIWCSVRVHVFTVDPDVG